MKYFFSAPNNSSDNNILNEFQVWTKSINTLTEILSDPNFDTKYPNLTKKDIIDLCFDKGNLFTISKTPRDELRNRFYSQFINK